MLAVALTFTASALAWRHFVAPPLDQPSKLREFGISSPIFFSERLLSASLDRYAIQGDHDLGGFMEAFEGAVHIAAVKAIDGPDVHRSAYPFVSHYNLQYEMAKAATHLAGGQGVYVAAVVLTTLAMGLVVGLLGAWAWREVSPAAGIAAAATFMLSPMMLERAASAYWAIYLCFLPMVAVLYGYSPRAGTARFLAVCGGLVVLVALKALTGYEYLSSVALAAAAAVVYHEVRAANGRLAPIWRRLVLRVAAVGLSCVAGFLVAAVLHIGKAAAFFGSVTQGAKAILLPFAYSTVGSETGIRGGVDPDLMDVAVMLVKTLVFRNWPINLPIVLLLASGVALAVSRRVPLDASLKALGWATMAAGVSTVSWEILAVRHSMDHPQINWITMYLGLLPFAAMLGAELLRRALAVSPGNSRVAAARF